MADHPLQEFRRWFSLAIEKEPFEANAMTLATCDAQGQPSARVLLLKELDDQGFVFFTNYESRKGQDLQINSRACLLFYWPSIHRQVRVEGICQRLTDRESDDYFDSRPRGARLSALTSRQSQPIASRQKLEALRSEVEAQWEGREPGRPQFWGGYRLVPQRLEFWQGQPDRLHDRFLYTRQEESWQRQRLMP